MKTFDDKAKYQAEREGVLGTSIPQQMHPTSPTLLALPAMSAMSSFRAIVPLYGRYDLSTSSVDMLMIRAELCHNWGTETDANFKGYVSGNEEPGRGFGHICISVDDLQAACKRFDDLGVKYKKRPEEGRMKVGCDSVP